MMKIKLLLVVLSLTLSGCGQTDKDTKKSSDKTLVLGTHIYIEKPENFKASKDFIGFESGRSLIQFIDLYGGDYYSNAKDFTKENFESKGLKVFKFEELKVDNYPAKFAIIQGESKLKSLQLVFGDNDFSVLAMAHIPEFEKEKIEIIKDVLLTINYDKKRIVDPFEIAFFELDDSESTYKYAKAASNFFFYSENGVKKQSYEGESLYMISQVPTEASSTNPRLLFDQGLNSLENNGLVISDRKITDRKKLNGFNCYEELVIGEINNEKVQIKITSVVNGTRAVIINGLIKNNFELTIKEFDKLTNTLIMK